MEKTNGKKDTQDIYAVIDRLMRLCALLRAEIVNMGEIAQKLPDDYQYDESGKRKMRRDMQSLEHLGYQIQRTGRPPRFCIEASMHILSDDEVKTLVMLRDMFGTYHPLSSRVQQLLDNLTSNLSEKQYRLWCVRRALRASLNPVLDYSGCEELMRWLSYAIQNNRQIGFSYRSKNSKDARWHPRLDPYDIEYYDRQYYLLAYNYEQQDFSTFRLNRIEGLPKLLSTPQPPRREMKRVRFVYRLPVSFADGGVSERFTIHEVKHDGEWVLVSASDTSEFRIMRILLSYGEHAMLIDGPPSLMERMRETIARMCVLYQEMCIIEQS